MKFLSKLVIILLLIFLFTVMIFMPQILEYTYTMDPWFWGFTKTTLEKSVLLQYYGTLLVGIGTILLAAYAVWQTNKSHKMTKEAMKMNRRLLDLENAKNTPILTIKVENVLFLGGKAQVEGYKYWKNKYNNLDFESSLPIFLDDNSDYAFFDPQQKEDCKYDSSHSHLKSTGEEDYKLGDTVYAQNVFCFCLTNESNVVIDKLSILKFSYTSPTGKNLIIPKNDYKNFCKEPFCFDKNYKINLGLLAHKGSVDEKKPTILAIDFLVRTLSNDVFTIHVEQGFVRKDYMFNQLHPQIFYWKLSENDKRYKVFVEGENNEKENKK